MNSICQKTFNRWCIIASGTFMILLWTYAAFSQSVIQVIGSKGPRATERQVQAHLDQLGVQENIHLTIRFSARMPEKLEGITISLPSPEPDVYQLLKVLIDALLSESKQRLVLAHEMIHVKQYVKEELVPLDKNKVVWQGRERYYTAVNNPVTPWEKEAYRGDRILAEMINSLPNPIPETLAEQMPHCISPPSSRPCRYLTEKCISKDQNELLPEENSNS